MGLACSTDMCFLFIISTIDLALQLEWIASSVKEVKCDYLSEQASLDSAFWI